MLPLAILSGLLVGGGLPAVYSSGLTAELTREANLLAVQLAGRIQTLMTARPRLWAYDADGLDAVVLPLAQAQPRAHFTIQTANEPSAYVTQPSVSKGGVLGWAAVRSQGKTTARISVRLDDSRIRLLSRNAWLSALTLGLILSIALYFLPVSTVRRSDVVNAELWTALESANLTLEERVQSRTAVLRETETELRDLGARLVKVQEEERARISRDLHDDLGQCLTGLRLRLSAAEAVLPSDNPAATHITAAIDAVDEGVEQVRGIAHQLRPPALDDLGLFDALHGHIEQWSSRYGLEVDSVLSPVQTSVERSEALFRTAQEAFTNVARHAQARRVTLRLTVDDKTIHLVMEDDGVGWNQDSTPGLGLIGIRERLLSCGGGLQLKAARIGGFRLEAWVPVEAGEVDGGH